MIEHILYFSNTHCGIFVPSASVSNRPVQFLSRITRIGWHKLRHWPPGTNKLPFVPPFFCLFCQVSIRR